MTERTESGRIDVAIDDASMGLRDAQSEMVIHPSSLKSTNKKKVVHIWVHFPQSRQLVSG